MPKLSRRVTAGSGVARKSLLRSSLRRLFFEPLEDRRPLASDLEDGALRIEPIVAYNLVVDSNVEAPSSYGPRAAHLGVKVTNTGSTPLTNVVVKMGDMTNAATGAGTPGVYPVTVIPPSDPLRDYDGSFSFTQEGGIADATRIIPSLGAGETVAVYVLVSYPVTDANNNSVAGAAPVTADDLQLYFDVWAEAYDGFTTRRVYDERMMTARNEISAMANKIWPNTTGKVPDEYLDAIETQLGWRPGSTPTIPGARMSEGIWYDLGNVGAGFDNNGDLIPDRNAWMQPVGDPDLYDASCVRLAKSYGLLIIKLNDGTEQLLAFQDQLYFENLPENNTGVVGLVFYEYLPLQFGCTATLSPYQEVASGYDNEKFNGDFGAAASTLSFSPPTLVFNKTGATSVAIGSNTTFTLSVTNQNPDLSPFGFPQFALPAVIEDAIPAGTTYVAGSAVTTAVPSGSTATVYYSTDGGLNWTSTEPVPASAVTHLEWRLNQPLAVNQTFTVQFATTVPSGYSSAFVDNCGGVSLGSGAPVVEDCHTVLVQGTLSIGDTVFSDNGAGGGVTGDGVQNGTEAGLANIGVSLYVDMNNDGDVDVDDLLWGTTSSNALGAYSFTNLPAGNFLVVVNAADPDRPTGWGVSSPPVVDVTLTTANVLTADFGFSPSLDVEKRLLSGSPLYEGDLVSYELTVTNLIGGPGSDNNGGFTSYEAWGTAPHPLDPNEWTNRGNAFGGTGEPDGAYASVTLFGSTSDELFGGGFSVPAPSGNITKVEAYVWVRTTGTFVNDHLHLHFKGNVGGSTLTEVEDAVMPGTLNAASSPQLVVIDITNLDKNPAVAGVQPWAWTDFVTGAQTLLGVSTQKTGAADDGTIFIDAIGFHITTDDVFVPEPFDPNRTLTYIPLQDVYNPAELTYVSASVPPDSVNTTTGVITWNNVGPLDAKETTAITVTFRAREPAGNVVDPSVINTVSSTGATFGNGLPANSDTDLVDVPLQPTAIVGDYIWNDLDSDGVQDLTEQGFPGVTVQLLSGSTVIATTVTGADGRYQFSGVRNGTYTVAVVTSTLPAGFTRTFDPDGPPLNNEWQVTVAGAANNLTGDFGYRSTTNIFFGTIFRDIDNDGVTTPEAGETGISGATVQLRNSSNVLIASTTTDANGNYRFTGVANGTYYVQVVTSSLPTGGTWSQTVDPDATLDNRLTATVTVSGGAISGSHNFAYYQSGTGTLGDRVFYDWDGDGVVDATDEGIPNIDVSLYRDLNNNDLYDPGVDAFLATTVTDANGFYLFTGLPAGEYVVLVNESDPQFPTAVIPTTDNPQDGSLPTSSTNLTTVDFGYQPYGAGAISGTVWHDVNLNEVQGVGENGLPSITVTLQVDLNGDGTFVTLATTSSDSTGAYRFDDLPFGAYRIVVDTNDVDLPETSTGATFDPTTATQFTRALTTIAPTATAHFGFTGLSSIGDTVYFDANRNGTQDLLEAGIPGVTVRLFADFNANGVADGLALATTTTNAAGYYVFSDLRPNLPGQYYLVEVDTATLPYPMLNSGDPDRDGVPWTGTPDAFPSADSRDTSIVLGAAPYTGADFGYVPRGAIGDYVWLDQDADGVQDPGEQPIAGVTVTANNGAGTIVTTTTDFDGRYSFANLADGTWTISVSGTPLAGLTPTFDADGGLNGSTSVSIVAGAVTNPFDSLGVDFGYRLNGAYSLSGSVCTNDARTIGVCDDVDNFFDDGLDLDVAANDETELAGQTVYLYRLVSSSYVLTGSTTTDADGDYIFSGLPNGAYKVVLNTTTIPLQNTSLTTTAADTPATVITTTAASVIQDVAIAGANVTNVDYAFVSTANYDFGDLPSGYGSTTVNQDGARHVIPSGGATVYLGTIPPDADFNGAPSAFADGDDLVDGVDDEDGVVPLNIGSWTNGVGGGSLQVTVPNGVRGYLVGWIDFNHDGSLIDSGEFVVDQWITGTGVPQTIVFDIPAGVIGATDESWLSRFRIFAAQPPYSLFSYEGVAVNGEVEDHRFERLVGAGIGDRVWVDVDFDGVQDVGEIGLPGVSVVLKNSVGTIVATQTTSDGDDDVDGDGVVDPAGYYRFPGLSAGAYTVEIVLPAGFNYSYDEDTGTTAPNGVTAVNLAANAQHLSADFGLRPQLADISGTVFYDANHDNAFGGDTGLGAVTVQLWTDPNGDGDPSDGTQVAEAYTSTGGAYEFTNVPSGRYVIVEVDPSGFVSDRDTAGANDNRIGLTLAGVDSTGHNFLDDGPALLSLSGYIYNDGGVGPFPGSTFSLDDTGIPGVTVLLHIDANENGVHDSLDPEIEVILTDVNGFYVFPNLPPGAYSILMEDLPGYVSENDTQGVPADNLIEVRLTTVSLANNNFLEDELAPLTGLIAGYVYADNNGDGIGDIGIPNVVVTLYADVDLNGVPDVGGPVDDPNQAGVQPFTVLTDGNGFYTFPNTLPGGYVIVMTEPAGYRHYLDGDTTVAGDDVANTNTQDNEIPVTIVAGETDDGNNFIDMPAATISGFVLADTDNDDDGDVGIAGVTLRLFYDAAGTLPVDDPNLPGVQTYTATTNASGAYSFPDLLPGAYFVRQTQPADYATVGDGDVTLAADDAANVSGLDDLIPVAVLAGETDDGNNFIEEQYAAVTGSVLVDTDNNNTGDVGLGGVTLTLWTDPNGDGDPADGAPVDNPNLPGVQDYVVTTSGAGAYAFTNLSPGSYVVVQTQPAGYLTVSDGDSTGPDGDAPNVSTLDDRIPVAVFAGETDDGHDFIEEQATEIRGSVLADTNDDNAGDVGLSGVTLTLYSDPNGDGDPSDGAPLDDPNLAGVQNYVVTTSPLGAYAFTNVAPGDYVVVQTQPAGYLTVGDGDSTPDVGDAVNASLTDDRIPVSTDPGEIDTGNDFVEEQIAAISGFVLVDTDDDNTGDSPLAGVSLTLYSDPNGDGDPSDGAPIDDPNLAGVQNYVATTIGTGAYLFTNLRPGAYVVVQTQPAGYSTVSDGDVTAPGDDAANASTTDDRIPVAVVAGETDTGNNFTEEPQNIISGSVFSDVNNDNVADAPLAGVTLTLWTDPNGDGDASDGGPVDSNPLVVGVQPYVVTTNAAGAYSFTGLAAGAYVVIQTQPSGYHTVSDGDSTAAVDDAPNASTLDDRIPVAVSGGEHDTGNDFLEEQSGVVRGTVTADANNDNLGDVALAGVEMTLWTDPNGDGDPSDGAPVDSDRLTPGVQPYVEFTDAFGVYSFDDVAPGSYVIVQTQPVGYLTIGDGDTTAGGDDAANVSVLDNRLPVAVGPGETDDGNDFVERQPAAIRGFVFVDTNNDNTADVGLAGVALTLWTDPNGDGDPADGAPVDDPNQVGPQDYVVTTDGTGAYAFTNLNPGAYVVVQTQPSGYFTLGDGDVTSPGDDAVNASTLDNRIPARVLGGENDDGNNFLEEAVQPPVATNDIRVGLAPGAYTMRIVNNDNDPNNDLDLNTIDLNPTLPGRQTSRTVDGEGVWTLGADGWVTFTPVNGFTRDPSPIDYELFDSTNLKSNVAIIQIEFVPIATDNSSTGHTIGTAVTQNVLANDTTGDTVNPTTVQIVGTSAIGQPLVVAGEGAWSVNSTTGAITFTPLSTFTGDPTPIRYTVRDFDGNVSNPARVIVDYVEPLCSSHPFTLILDDASTPFIDVIVVDNAPIGTMTSRGPSNFADASNTTIGEIYFSGSTPRFSLARTSAKSKPLVGTAIEPEITLVSAFRSSLGGTITVEATDGCYQVIAGTPYTFASPIGGTSNGTVTFREFVDPSNSAFATGPNRVTNTIGPLPSGSISRTTSGAFTPSGSAVSLAKLVTVTHPSGSRLTTLTAGGTLTIRTDETDAGAVGRGGAGWSDSYFSRLGEERSARNERRFESARTTTNSAKTGERIAAAPVVSETTSRREAPAVRAGLKAFAKPSAVDARAIDAWFSQFETDRLDD